MPKRKPGRASTQSEPSGGAKPLGAWRLFSIGHSHHSVAQLLGLLRRYGIETVVDVRSAPGSRYVPHFDAGPLRTALAAAGIAYMYLGKELGGRPQRREFFDERGRVLYERLAHSPPFRRGMNQLACLVERSCVALLCSEEDPAACHRRLLIGPAAAATGLVLGHIRATGAVQTEAHLGHPPGSGALEALEDPCRQYLQLRLL
jgi:uncharacterized protein (DUF488 family)